jgi:putative transposase
MPNHIHLVWQIQDKHQKASVQQTLLKYTAQQIKLTMISTGNKEVEKYKVKASENK